MRALVLRSNPEFDSTYPVPIAQEGEALIRVLKAGICATDVQLIQGYMGFQGILGHEFVGIIEQCPNQKDLINKRVVGEINLSCRQCATCKAGRLTHCPNRTTLGIDRKDGAFADYLTLPTENLYVLPEHISDSEAIFIEPLAAACNILDQTSLSSTDQVVVIGDGKLGLLCAQVLHTHPCSVTVLGRHREKLALMSKRGISCTTKMEDINPGVDVVVEATGTPQGLATAIELVRPRGTIILKSTYHGKNPIDMTALVINEVSLIGSRCGPFPKALRLLNERRIDVESMITEQYPISRGLDALHHATENGALKVILEMRYT